MEKDSPNMSGSIERRPRFGHLISMLWGGQLFVPILEPMLSAWIEGRISDRKMRFIALKLRANDEFSARFNSVFTDTEHQVYLNELVEDGVLYVEEVSTEDGGTKVLHSTNEVEKWDLRELRLSLQS